MLEKHPHLVSKIQKKFWRHVFVISASAWVPLVLFATVFGAPFWFSIPFFAIATYTISTFFSVLSLSKKHPHLFPDVSREVFESGWFSSSNNPDCIFCPDNPFYIHRRDDR